MRFPYSLILLLFVCTPSLAYIDPGVGGFLWQGFIALMVGVVFQVVQFFKGKPDTHGSDSATPSEQK